MIKRNLLKIGCIVTITGALLAGCGSKDTVSVIQESTSSVSEEVSTTEEETTTEETSTTEEIETSSEVETTTVEETTTVKTKVTTQSATKETKKSKPVQTQSVTKAPITQVETTRHQEETTTFTTSTSTSTTTSTVVVEDHSKDDYNWAVEKVAEWKAINPDPAYLIGMFGCYAEAYWSYDYDGVGGKWKHAISYYKSGVCDDIETCFRTFCNVAGITCERQEDEDHTWDIVTLDGVRYIVDMTDSIILHGSMSFDDIVAYFHQGYYGDEQVGIKANRLVAVQFMFGIPYDHVYDSEGNRIEK